MAADIVRKQTPEEKEVDKKRLELTRLEEELLQRELDLTTLRVELSVFEREYLRVVGSRYAKLDKIEAQIAAIQAERSPADSDSQQAAREASERAEASARESNSNQSQPVKPEFVPTEDLKKLYREAARRVHPDLATDENDRIRRHTLMAEVNRAYEEGDATRLRELFNDLEGTTESSIGIAAELIRLIRQIAQIEDRLAQIAAAFAALQQSDLCNLRQRAEKYAASGRNLLNTMAADIDKKIATRRKRLADLTEGE
jgi:hypothetical protein